MRKSSNILLSLGFIMCTLLLSAQSPHDALQAMYGERYETAITIIKKLIKDNPDNPMNYYYAGYIYKNISKIDSAKYFFNRGIIADDDAPLNYIGKASIALNIDMTETADKLFNKAIEESSRSNRAIVYNHIADAILSADEPNTQKAMTYLEQALDEKIRNDAEKKLTNAETQVLMGDVWIIKDNLGKAVNHYETAMYLNENLTARLRTKIGEIYLSAGNAEAALIQFEKAQVSDPKFAPVYKYLGEIYFTFKNDVEKAKKMYQKYLQLSDISSGSKDRYAAFLYVSKEFDKAIPKIKEVLSTNPDNIIMNRLLGYSYYKTQEFEKAVDAFNSYYELVEPEDELTTDYVYYGKSLMKTGKDSIGAEYLFIAVDRDSTQLKMVEELAQNLVKEKKYTQSARLYTGILERLENPSAQDFYAAGRVYMQAKQLEKADSSFAHVIQLSPDSYIGYYMMAVTKYYQDTSKAKILAKPYYDKVIELTVDNPEKYKNVLIGAYTYMASYYDSIKDMEMAKSYWDKILELDPDNPNAIAYNKYYKEVKEYERKVKERAKKKAAYEKWQEEHGETDG